MEITVDTLEFDVDRVPRRFVLINNIRQFGVSIENIFTDWIRHAADITPENLCKFIRSMNENIICITEEEYKQGYLTKMHVFGTI